VREVRTLVLDTTLPDAERPDNSNTVTRRIQSSRRARKSTRRKTSADGLRRTLRKQGRRVREKDVMDAKSDCIEAARESTTATASQTQ
jgi:hypothetical protein